MTNDCIFCKIVKGEIPSKKVYEDKDVLAFLDINPANPGHTLIIPKKHFEGILDIDDATLSKLITVAKKVAAKMKQELNTAGLNIVQSNGKAAGQVINHIHFHVIPRFAGDQIVISYQPQKLDEKQLDEIQKKLSASKSKDEKPPEFDFKF